MAEGKLDLPDDLLSSKPSDQSWTSKVEISGGNGEEKVLMASSDELKDPAASDSSIPLSPQWLYAKPTESKLEMRGPTSLGNSTDSNQKEGWRLEGSEDKKDWRRPATESENSRRWREEERETSLLGGRRDRRKTERRVDNIPLRDTTDSRALPTSDRWHDGRNEVRRDSKWSSRWGPEDKEKESRTEKRTDVEKDDAHSNNESQSLGGNNRSATERESDSRDKWRPRHRMEVHTGGSATYRAAPGFGVERGRVEGSNLGFTLGRGRSNGIGRSSTAGAIGFAPSGKSESVPGKPRHSADSFCYPRGKLLDIYRQRKPELSFDTMPDEMEESPSITQVDFIEPLAFHAPVADEEAILSDIWKGKITSSGVVYNSFRKGRSSENITGVGDLEAADGVLGILPSTITEDPGNAFQEAANADDYGTLWNYSSQRNAIDEKDVNHKQTDNRATEGKDLDGMSLPFQKSNGIRVDSEIDGSYNSANQLHVSGSRNVADSAFSNHPLSDDIEIANSSNIRSKLPHDSNTLYCLASSEQNENSNSLVKDLERDVSSEDLALYYLDPQGVTQGPYLGADIISWFEQGFFGTDLLVRLEDTPEGTPFIELGELMPHLKFWDGHANVITPSSKIEDSSGLVGSFESSLPFSAVSESNYSFLGNDHQRPLPELNSLSAQHIQPRISEPEAPLQLPSRGQSFNGFVEQDEDIVFPGIHGTTAYSTARSSGSIHDPLANSISHLPPSTELTESGVSIQNDNKLHPFGLLWSELEGAQTKHSKSANMPSTVGRAVPFGANPDAVAETWSDVHRKNSVADPNLYEEMLAPHQMSHMEQESSHYDLAEQLMSQQIQQQQLQQRNMLSGFAHLNDTVLEPSQNLIHHQQLPNHSSADLDHLLALQMQQQRQVQLQQHQLQQQQLHQQQKLLQEQQQSQVQQVLLEQLLRGQMHDPALRQPHIDPVRANHVLDQVLLEQQLLRELQQRSHHLPRHVDPAMEQLIQAKFGHTPQGHQSDLFELLSRAQHEQIQSLEHQMHARQLGIRQRMEEERHIGSVWPGDESNQIFRNHAGAHGHRAHSSGFSPLDFYQRQQRQSHEEQLSHLDRNLSFQDRLQQGFYEPGSLPFERSMSLPAGAPGMNLDVVNAMARAQGLDMQESIGRMQSAGQSGTFSSAVHSHNSHHPLVPNQFHVSHLDAIEGHWPEKNEHLENDWMDSRFQQLHINAERQKRESEIKNTSQDQNLWMSDGINDENSKRLLMELLHQKSGHQPSESLNAMSNGLFSDNRLLSGHYSGSSSSNHPFNFHTDQEAGLNNSFRVGSFGSNPGEFLQEEQACSVESNEKLMYRSNSGALADRESFLAGINATNQSLYTNSNMISKSSIGKELSELEGRKRGSKSEGLIMGRAFETQERMVESAGLAATNFEERSSNASTMHSSSAVSGGNTGFYSDKIGRSNSFVEETAKDRVPIPSKGQENILLRRPPISSASASQEGLSELISDPVLRGKNSSVASDGGRQDSVPVNQGSDVMASSKKEMHFRRTSSASDAEVSEASFIDMLKSNNKKIAPMDAHATAGFSESSDAQGGRSGKKKGKKGRQIDPALLGFKVTSNRIMMGEIQRIEE